MFLSLLEYKWLYTTKRKRNAELQSKKNEKNVLVSHRMLMSEKENYFIYSIPIHNFFKATWKHAWLKICVWLTISSNLQEVC